LPEPDEVIVTTESRANEIMQYSFLVALADDGTLDEGELGFIKRLALKDGVLDDDEREVLSNIFSRLDMDRLGAPVQAEIAAFRREFGIA